MGYEIVSLIAMLRLFVALAGRGLITRFDYDEEFKRISEGKIVEIHIYGYLLVNLILCLTTFSIMSLAFYNKGNEIIIACLFAMNIILIPLDIILDRKCVRKFYIKSGYLHIKGLFITKKYDRNFVRCKKGKIFSSLYYNGKRIITVTACMMEKSFLDMGIIEYDPNEKFKQNK